MPSSRRRKSSSEIIVSVRRRSSSVIVRKKPKVSLKPYLHEDVLQFRESVWNSTSSDCERELHTALEEFCKSKASLDAVLMLQVLYNIHKRIHDEPDVEKYYRVYIKGSIFEKYVWNLDGSEDFLLFCGWIKCGNYLLLSKSYPIASSLKVIENVLKEKKKTKVGYSSSDRKPSSKRPELFKRRTKSNVGETVINEDELVASFTNIETDSAVDSGLDEEEINDSKEIKKKKLQRVESKEQVFGDEEYIVVDFIGDLEVSSSRKTSQVEQASSPESAIGLSPPSPQSPTSESSPTDNENLERPVEAKKDKINDEEGGRRIDEGKDDDAEDEKSMKQESEPIVTAEILPKQVVYSAGKGLKGLSKDAPSNAAAEKEGKAKSVAKKAPDTKKASEGGAPGESVSRSSSNRSTNSRNLSDEQILRSSADKTVSSSVLQNKLLFDQQIANQWKRETSVDSNSSSQNVSRRSSIRSQTEMPASGTVAGARSMFEATSTPTPAKKSGWEVKLEPVPPTPKSPETDETAQTLSTEKKAKKKRFPFKKKSKKATEKKEDENEPVANDVKPCDDIPADESNKVNVSSDITNESIESEKEPDHVERKKKGSIFSKMRRLSRKSSGGESSDNEPEKAPKPVEPKQPLEDEVIEEKDEVPEPSSEEQSKTDQLTLDIPLSRTSTNSSLPTPDVAPPSPGYASSEITAVLEGIIGRKSSLLDDDEEEREEGGSPKKKKRLKLKKKSSSKKLQANESETTTEDISVIPEDDNIVEDNKTDPDDLTTANDVENPTVVADSKPIVEDHIPVVEDATTVVVKSDAPISEWPEEFAPTNEDDEKVDEITLPQEDSAVETGTSEELTSNNSKVDIVVDTSLADDGENDVLALPATHGNDVSDFSDMTDGDTREEDELVAALENAGSTYDSDTLSVSTTGTNAEKKRRRLKLKFPKRKSSKKNKNDKDLSPSPQKERQIWEDESNKSEKKHSKKLKRPKSLDFLADVISPSRKTDKNRPFSMAGEPIDEKSPTKKKTFSSSLFKKKKKPKDPIHIPTDGSVTSDGSVIPSPEHSPDDFKIPDVVDGQAPPENGHAVLTTKLSLQSGHSDHSTGLAVQVDNQGE